MPYSMLQWLGPELARAGMVRNEVWVERHAAEAVALFADKDLHIAATLMAATHPAGIDYIRQAPALVVAVASGRHLYRPRERAEAADRWRTACHAGGKLRGLMSRFDVAYPLRTIDGTALYRSQWNVLGLLSELPPSTLAQCVPKLAELQRHWLRGLSDWVGHLKRYYGQETCRITFPWIATELGRAPCDFEPTAIADFIGQNRERFNPRWSLERARELAEAWHQDLMHRHSFETFFAEFGLCVSDLIDYGTFPDFETVHGFEIVALRSGEAIYAEGAAMNHCVVSYCGAVIRGHSRLFSIRRNGKRVATAEFARGSNGFSLAQVKGPRNASPTRGVMKALRHYIRTISNRQSRAGAC